MILAGNVRQQQRTQKREKKTCDNMHASVCKCEWVKDGEGKKVEQFFFSWKKRRSGYSAME